MFGSLSFLVSLQFISTTMFDGFKRRVGSRIIKKQLAHVTCKRRFHNLSSAKSIGLLYLYSDATEREIDSFMRFLAKKGIKVTALAYIAETSAPLLFRVADNKKMFCKTQTNWFGKPHADEVDSFIKTPFDILIDFNQSKNYSLQYIAASSHAAMRVGRLAYNNNPYEFIISMPANAADDAYIRQVEQYLQTIQIA